MNTNPQCKQEKDVKTRQKAYSLRKVINDMCKACIYDGSSGGGTWRQQVEACTGTKCPLYPVRPKSQTKKSSDIPTDSGHNPVEIGQISKLG